MQPPEFDLHTHTIYCGHAAENMLVPNLLRAADEKGVHTVAITEHVHTRRDLGRIDRIRYDLTRAAHACTVFVGAEIDADSVAADGSLIADHAGLAYVIASTHHFPGTESWWYDKLTFTPEESRAMIVRWFDWAERIVCNPAVDTLAHPGALIARPGLTEAYDDEWLECFRRLFAVAAEHNTRVEINDLLGKKLRPAHLAGYPEVIRAAREAGCRLVMVSDAHRPADVACFDWALGVAEAAGVTEADLTLPEFHAEGYGTHGGEPD